MPLGPNLASILFILFISLFWRQRTMFPVLEFLF